MKLASLCVVFASASACLADTVTVGAIKDNTLYKIADGSLSNGLGYYCFAGTTSANETRRAVVAFDLSAVPSGVHITSATLRMTCSRQATAGWTVRAYRLLQDWGEGTSDASSNEGIGAISTPGDATWIHTVYDNRFWTSPGGTFVPTASGAAVVNGLTVITWSGPAMAADVQRWVDDRASNFGWILVGDEDNLRTAQRFNTRHHPTITSRPALVIEYTRCRADFNGDNQADFFDYLDFVQAYSQDDPAADFNGDNQVDFFDYLDFVQAFSDCG